MEVEQLDLAHACHRDSIVLVLEVAVWVMHTPGRSSGLVGALQFTMERVRRTDVGLLKCNEGLP